MQRTLLSIKCDSTSVHGCLPKIKCQKVFKSSTEGDGKHQEMPTQNAHLAPFD